MARSDVWRASGQGVVRVPPSTTMLESKLESWIEEEPSILGAIIIIGKQVTTDTGGRIDLLGMDILGNLVVIELKRDRASSLVVSQVLSYGAWVESLSEDEVRQVFRRYRPDVPLEAVFFACFGVKLGENVNAGQSYVVVASRVDQSTQDSVDVLSRRGFPIQLILFEHFEDRDAHYFVRLTLERGGPRRRSSPKQIMSPISTQWKNISLKPSSNGISADTKMDSNGARHECMDDAHVHTGQSCSWPTQSDLNATTVVAISRKSQRTLAGYDEEVEKFWLLFSSQLRRDHYAYRWLFELYLNWKRNDSSDSAAHLLYGAFVRRLKPVATASNHWIDNRARPGTSTRVYEPLMDKVPDTLPARADAARRGLRRIRRAD